MGMDFLTGLDIFSQVWVWDGKTQGFVPVAISRSTGCMWN